MFPKDRIAGDLQRLAEVTLAPALLGGHQLGRHAQSTRDAAPQGLQGLLPTKSYSF